jgi:hypothetical protein
MMVQLLHRLGQFGTTAFQFQQHEAFVNVFVHGVIVNIIIITTYNRIVREGSFVVETTKLGSTLNASYCNPMAMSTPTFTKSLMRLITVNQRSDKNV